MNGNKTASATIHLTKGRLPSTGEHPNENMVSLLIAVAALLSGAVIGVGARFFRKREN
jgi:hypothetical protein